MKQEQILKRLRTEAKELWLNYLHCEKVTRASVLLKRRDKKMQTVHRLQTSINLLFILPLHNETNPLQEVLEMVRENKLQKESIAMLQNNCLYFI